MVIISGIKHYTLDEVVYRSGYQKGTIYNLTSQGIITHPIRGASGDLYPSQGLYSYVVFSELDTYKKLKNAGLRKKEIIRQLQDMRSNTNESILPLLET